MGREESKYDYDLEKLRVITPRKGDFKMLVTPGFYADQYGRNIYEDFTSDLVLGFSKDNMLFIDIGAHYGYYTLLVGTSHPDCKIIAFEPVPENFEILKRNVALNQMRNVQLNKLAVSNKSEVRKLEVTEITGQSGFYKQPAHGAKACKEVEVRTVCLDKFLKKAPKVPTVIKIDAEGNEPYILQGMKKFLKNSEDIKLVIEFNLDCLRSAGYTPTEFFEEVFQLGFDIYVIDDNKKMTYKMDRDNLEKWADHLPDGELEKIYTNMLCVKKQKSLSVLLFSHSAQLAGAERSLLDLTKQLADRSVVCSVILPSDGPLRGMLEEQGISTLIIDYRWWCDLRPLQDDEIKGRLSNSVDNILDRLAELSKINPDVIFTNTLVIPWGAVAASLLGKPHVWFIHEFGELKFHLPFQTVLKVIEDSSNLTLVNSNALGNSLLGATRSKRILTLKDNFTEEKSGNELAKLLRRLKGTTNPSFDNLSQFAVQAVLTTLKTKDAHIAELGSVLQAKDAHIAELGSVLQAKDAQIAELNTALQAKDAQIAELNSSLQAKDVQIRDLEVRLHERDTQIAYLNVTLQQIQRSIVMQLVSRYQRVVEKLLRPGTRRRYHYELMLTGIRVILNEGRRNVSD